MEAAPLSRGEDGRQHTLTAAHRDPDGAVDAIDALDVGQVDGERAGKRVEVARRGDGDDRVGTDGSLELSRAPERQQVPVVDDRDAARRGCRPLPCSACSS